MRIAPCYYRRLILVVILAGLVYSIIQVLRSELSLNEDELTSDEKLMRISKLIRNSEKQSRYIGDGVPACKIPELDINDPAIMKFIHDVPALDCAPVDWVKADGSKLVIDEKIKKKYGPITCAFNEILRVNDYSVKSSKTVEADDFYTLRESDFAEVNCESQSGKQWHNFVAGVKDDPATRQEISWGNVPESVLKLNVLMFGFDSLSRNSFARKLPRTYRYLKQTLNTLILEGYNIVGDGTPQALIPILTGKIELELPETRRRMEPKANYVDVYPMIWKDYKEKGYITGFMEDVPHIGTFTYRLKGFKHQPTDHYMRTFYLAASPYFKYSKKYCLGGVPRHMLMLNYMKSIFDSYRDKPKFLFGFHGELSHDSYNDIGAADDDLHDWIKDMYSSGQLNNTILILMSDHGHRFAEIRDTLQGKQEERLPFFSFTFPPWFKQVHPRAYANFVYNSRHLTTPFDIHETLRNVLNFQTVKEGDRRKRAISLFDKVPLERTCADAFIEPHWCACLGWQELPVDDANAVAASQYFVKFLNSYTEAHRELCDKLTLGAVLWSAKLIPTKGLLDFHKSEDQDGFVGDFSANTKLTTEMYQVKIRTEPGKGLFEGSISYDVQRNIFSMKISDVSRINKYGSQARCVENHLFHLRKYCHCRD